MAENFVKRLGYDPIGGATNASGVAYDNDDSGLTADNVQDAIDELATENDAQDILIAAETARALAAEQALDDKIDQEIADRIADVNAEETRALAAEALLIPLAQKGAANGVVPLNGASQIDPIYLPSYVDDVLEFPSLSAFPAVGETGKIYVALDTNKTYRWSGSTYIEVSPSEVRTVFGRSGDVVATPGDYTASQVTNVPTGNLAATNVQTALNELQTDIDTRATQAALSAEITRATTAEGLLDDRIDQEILDRTAADDAEEAARIAADLLLDQAIDDETTRALAAEDLIQDNLDNHIADPTGAHSASAISYDDTIVNRLTAIDVQDAIDELALRPAPSIGDIEETAVALSASQTNAPVSGLVFSPAVVRSFEVFLSVEVTTGVDLFETVKITGTQRASSFTITVKSSGDISGVTFDVTNLGQITYTSPAFTSGAVAYRAIVTNVI